MNILVTGASGFIGTHLCLVLEKDNVVFKYDRFGTFLRDIFEENKIDVVFHLAANADIVQLDAGDDIDDTLLTTISILGFCAIHGVKQFVFASSGTVYGDTCGSTTERHPTNPLSHYAAAKVASEAFISSYSNIHGIQSWICRLPNVIGKDNRRGIILNFINQLQSNPRELNVIGDGRQTKPYMHVDDCVDAMIYVWKHAKERLNIFNISSWGTTTVKDIAEMVVKEMGDTAKINYTKEPRMWIGDVKRYMSNPTKLFELGWTPERSSSEAVERVIKELL